MLNSNCKILFFNLININIYKLLKLNIFWNYDSLTLKCPSCPPLVVPGASDPALQPNRYPSPPCMLLPVLPGSQHHQIRGEVTTRVPIDMVDLFLAPQLSVVQVLPELAVEEHFIGFGAWQSEKKIAIPMLMVGDHLWHSHHASICFPLLCLKFGKIIRHQSNP